MTELAITDEGSYRAQQQDEAAKFAYAVEVIIRLRARQLTDDDVRFIENELLPPQLRTI